MKQKNRASRAFLFLILLSGYAAALEVANPYHDVKWGTAGQHKANLHTHTKKSDGKLDPASTIDLYREHGYDILALTDHDIKGPKKTTWPWSDFDRDADTLGMVAIEGNEISRKHHLNSLFNSYGNADIQSEEEAIREIGKLDGIAFLNHPGRYTRKENSRYTVPWYVDIYRRHSHLVGLEIFNRAGTNFAHDRALWDSILTEILPERAVWGFGNDDMHTPGNLGFSWNVLILQKLSNKHVRRALERGQFFFANSPNGIVTAAAPEIQRITVDENAGTIQIEANDATRIEWIAEGKIIGEGATCDLNLIAKAKYVRAMVYGSEEIVVGTQPFTLKY